MASPLIDGGLVNRIVGALLVIQSTMIAAGLTLAADIYAHKRTEPVGGVNVWGYRGPVARQRQSGEIRIVFVGGTRAFGWGATATETIPATVRWTIMLATDLPGEPLRPVVDINLARIGAQPATYAQTLHRHDDLLPDYVCIYDDFGADAEVSSVSRTFRTTGYAPVLPLVLEEKGMAWRYGSVAAGYGAAPPEDVSSVHAAAGITIGAIGRLLARADRVAPALRHPDYVAAMAEAIEEGRRQARGVIVAVGPVTTQAQREMADGLRRHLRAAGLLDGDVRLIDLSSVDGLRATNLTLDGHSYNGEGRARVAAAIAAPLLEWIQSR